MVFFVVSCAAGEDGLLNGGVKGEIVSISTYGELKTFADRVNAGEPCLNAELLADIEIPAGEKWVPIGWIRMKEGNPFFSFDEVDWDNGLYWQGSFNGNGHTISGIQIDAGYSNSKSIAAGFFGICGENSIIRNLTLEGTITVTEKLGWVGGIAGHMDKGSLIDCTSKMSINARSMVVVALGGLAGHLQDYSLVMNCVLNTGNNTGWYSNGESVEHKGNIVGRISDKGKIINCSTMTNGSKQEHEDYTSGSHDEFDRTAIGAIEFSY